MGTISFIISIFTALFMAFIYLKHERKLKTQEEKLNEINLKKHDEAEANAKKADVRANLIKPDNGRRELKIYNKGQSQARNIFVEFLNNSDEEHQSLEYILNIQNPSPYELLNTQENFVIKLIVSEYSSVDKVKIKISWEDDFGTNNEHIQIIQL